jgi:hypothetical protein
MKPRSDSSGLRSRGGFGSDPEEESSGDEDSGDTEE